MKTLGIHKMSEVILYLTSSENVGKRLDET